MFEIHRQPRFFFSFFCWETQVADQYWEPLDVKTHMLILLLPLILINYVRNLKLLAPFSTLANAITFVGLAMILVYMFKDLPSVNEREMFGTLRNFSLYFGTTLFALEAVGVVSFIHVSIPLRYFPFFDSSFHGEFYFYSFFILFFIFHPCSFVVASLAELLPNFTV